MKKKKTLPILETQTRGYTKSKQDGNKICSFFSFPRECHPNGTWYVFEYDIFYFLRSVRCRFLLRPYRFIFPLARELSFVSDMEQPSKVPSKSLRSHTGLFCVLLTA